MAGQLHELVITAGSVFVINAGRAEPGSPGAEFLSVAVQNWKAGPAQRGKPYAGNGSIISLDVEGSTVDAYITGSGHEYLTSIRGAAGGWPFDLSASCDCMYGSMNGDWCKHAVALSYACAALLDGRVEDQTGELVPLVKADRTDLLAGAAALLADADFTRFNPDAAFAAATQWLSFPTLEPRAD